MEEFVGCLGVIALVVLLFLVSPFVGFILGSVTGYCIKWIFGAGFCQGLALLGINIGVNSIPLFCGTLGVIGSFFKSSTTVKRERR